MCVRLVGRSSALPLANNLQALSTRFCLLPMLTVMSSLVISFELSISISIYCTFSVTSFVIYGCTEPRKMVQAASSSWHQTCRFTLSFAILQKNVFSAAEYIRVDLHRDKYKPWNHLTLDQQLNCHCNMLAKSALHRGIMARPQQHAPFIVPMEQ